MRQLILVVSGFQPEADNQNSCKNDDGDNSLNVSLRSALTELIGTVGLITSFKYKVTPTVSC